MTREQIELQAVNTLKRCSIEKLLDLFAETDKRKITTEVAMTRGWIMDALEAKMTADQFDKWLDQQ